MAVYDIATGKPIPVEDPPQTTWMDETDGMTDAEQSAFARGVAWSARLLCQPADTPDPASVAKAARVVQDYRDARRPRLEVAR